MELQDYIDKIHDDICVRRESQGEGLRKSFVQSFCTFIPETAIDLDDIHQLYVDRKVSNQNIAIDGYVLNSEEHTLYMIIADWNDFDNPNKLTETEASTLFNKLRNFFSLAKKGKLQEFFEFSTPEYELEEIVRSEDIERVHFMLFTDRLLSERIKKIDSPIIDNVATDAEIWGIERLYEYSKLGLDHEPLNLDFSQHPIPLTLATEGDGYKAYLGVMPAEILANLYISHGGKLLEGNVRSFLTLKTSVNRDIRGTILAHPEKFFIFNNGIAVTTRKLSLNNAGAMIAASDFQIINGGQTTASLARVAIKDKKDISSIMVAMKLTAIDDTLAENDAQDLMRNISKCSNNQNKVSAADFSSSHPLHIFMEQCSSRIFANAHSGQQHGIYWFYERNRGSFEQHQVFLKGTELKQFKLKFDKKRLIKKEDLARVWLSWEGKPHIVSKGAATLFAFYMDEINTCYYEEKEKGRYGDQFFKNTVALFILYTSLRDAISKQYWYEGGYRANIVTYTIAIFSKIFETKFGKDFFDFNKIWENQSIAPDLENYLLKIAKQIKNVLTSNTRTVENVTQWAKIENCWNSVLKKFETTPIPLPEEANNWRITRETRTESRKQEREVAKIDSEINLQTKVLNYAHWNDALTFSSNCSVLSDMQKAALNKAALIPKKIPFERECKLALSALDKLRTEGFPF